MILKLKELLKNPFGQAVIGLIAISCAIVFFAAMTDWHGARQVEKTIQRNNTEANVHIDAANQHQANAANSANVRAVEDLRRNEIIQPRRRNAQANSDNARQKTGDARKRYEKAINSNSVNFNADDVCRVWADIHPNERLEGCQ